MESVKVKISPNKQIFGKLLADHSAWTAMVTTLSKFFFAMRGKPLKIRSKTGEENEVSTEDWNQYLLSNARTLQEQNLGWHKLSDEQLIKLHRQLFNAVKVWPDDIRSIQGLMFSVSSNAGNGHGRLPNVQKYPKGHDYWQERASKQKKGANELFAEALKKYEKEKEGRDALIDAAKALYDAGVFPFIRSESVDPVTRVASKRAAAEIAEYEGKCKLREKEYSSLQEKINELQQNLPNEAIEQLQEVVTQIQEHHPTFRLTRRMLRGWYQLRKRWIANHLKGQAIESNLDFFREIAGKPQLWLEVDYVSRYQEYNAIYSKASKINLVEVLPYDRERWFAWEDDTRPVLTERNGVLYLKVRHFDQSFSEVKLAFSGQLKGLKVLKKSGKNQLVTFKRRGQSQKITAAFKSANLYLDGGDYYFNLTFERELPTIDSDIDKIAKYFATAHDSTAPNINFDKKFNVMVVDLGIAPLAVLSVMQWRPGDLSGEFVDPHKKGSFHRKKLYHYEKRPSLYLSYRSSLNEAFEFMNLYKAVKLQNKETCDILSSKLNVVLNQGTHEDKLRAIDALCAEKINGIKVMFKKLKFDRCNINDRHGYDWCKAVRSTISLLGKWMDRHLMEKKEKNDQVRLAEYWKYYNNLTKDLGNKFAYSLVDQAKKNNCQVMIFDNFDNYSTSEDKRREHNQLLSIWRKQTIKQNILDQSQRNGIIARFDSSPLGTTSRHWKDGEIGLRVIPLRTLFTKNKRPINYRTNGCLAMARKWACKDELNSLYFDVIEYQNKVYYYFANESRKRVTGNLLKIYGQKLCLLDENRKFVDDVQLARRLSKQKKVKRQKLYFVFGSWLTEDKVDGIMEAIEYKVRGS